MKTEYTDINNLKYWISQVQIIYHIIIDVWGNEREEYYCPFCHNTGTRESNLYHDEGCPLDAGT